MKRVTVTIDPAGLELPLAFERASRDVDVRVVNWNVSRPTAAFLLHVRGDVDRFEALLEGDSAVAEYELLPVDSNERYCFVAGEGTDDARALWETFDGGTLMTIPPAEWNADGTYTFTVVGRDGDVQAAVDGVPRSAGVSIESVGGTTVADETALGRLTDRQRRALRTAVELGYYESPRGATIDDVADELGCATSTAAEHLQKGESTVIRALFDT